MSEKLLKIMLTNKYVSEWKQNGSKVKTKTKKTNKKKSHEAEFQELSDPIRNVFYNIQMEHFVIHIILDNSLTQNFLGMWHLFIDGL